VCIQPEGVIVIIFCCAAAYLNTNKATIFKYSEQQPGTKSMSAAVIIATVFLES